MSPKPPTPADALGDAADAVLALASALLRLHGAITAPHIAPASVVGPLTLPTAVRCPSDQKREKVRGSQRDRWPREQRDSPASPRSTRCSTSPVGWPRCPPRPCRRSSTSSPSRSIDAI